jgi:hydrogenase-4 component B
MTFLALIFVAVAILGVTVISTALLARSDHVVLWVGTAGSTLGCILGTVLSILALISDSEESLRVTWTIPIGEFHVGIDPLTAFFLLCIFVVSGLATVYGSSYLRGYLGKRRLAPALVFFNLLVAAMATLVLARDGVLFLMAWEMMSVASFFLVTYESERDDVRRAGMTYLIASHLGAVFLFILFGLLSRETGSFDFDSFTRALVSNSDLSNVCFLLALLGFGTKAGFWPFHIWLPDAHPAAPSHVSALMSGVMIKMGIYGLLRIIGFLGKPPPWWGVTVLAIGAISGIAGVLHALAQHDLKRLLAYHSVENIGIIALGIGIGLLGQSHGESTLAFLGYAGALLHILNHGLFKGMLFQAAGSVLHATGTRDTESLGGLSRRMPVTSLMFLIGSIAICGFPPLNGFVSEWLIYVGAFKASSALPTLWAVTSIIVVPALALIGGLATACFVKAFGVVFLGEARTTASSKAHESDALMTLPMVLGAVLCALIGFWPAGVLTLVAPVASGLAGAQVAVFDVAGPLNAISRVASVLVSLILLLTLLRYALLRRRDVKVAATWGCGYPAPTARMQYTAASFAQPLLTPFASVLHVQMQNDGPEGFFPRRARYDEHLGDMAGERMLVPASQWIVHTLSQLRILQHGRIHLYLVYIFATLIMLLVWQLSGLGG